MACYIIGAGDFFGFEALPQTGDLVIAADGGLAVCQKYGITPNLILGDFDSLGYVPQEENVLQVPVEKDDTDMMLAVKKGLSAGQTEFYIYGGTGGRLDHTVANLQTLLYLTQNSAQGWLYDKMGKFTSVKNGALELPAQEDGIFSVFAFDGDAEGVTILGGKYKAENMLLKAWQPMGVSNSFTGQNVSISVKRGSLLVGIIDEGKKEEHG